MQLGGNIIETVWSNFEIDLVSLILSNLIILS